MTIFAVIGDIIYYKTRKDKYSNKLTKLSVKKQIIDVAIANDLREFFNV